ncbi:MAG TPA: glycosyltransferase [Candidatus Omnitrophota bacterium]|nr:glycosyltransferase [Candidatus Omnitrophota bacterium]HPS20455.1 glycosyltransferase [Candidatus Omnitrophota bacterium]
MENDISIIIPVYGKQNGLEQSIGYLSLKLADTPFKAHFIIVNNSGAQNKVLLTDLVKSIKNLIVISPLNGETSQSAAYIAGFSHAESPWAMLMDTDMLCDWASIKKLLDSLNPNFDAVRTFRINRNYYSPHRMIGSKITNFIINFSSKVRLRDAGSSLSIYHHRIYKKIFCTELAQYHSFLPFLLQRLTTTDRIKEIPIDVSNAPSHSHYGFFPLFNVFSRILLLKIRLLLLNR